MSISLKRVAHNDTHGLFIYGPNDAKILSASKSYSGLWSDDMGSTLTQYPATCICVNTPTKLEETGPSNGVQHQVWSSLLEEYTYTIHLPGNYTESAEFFRRACTQRVVTQKMNVEQLGVEMNNLLLLLCTERDVQLTAIDGLLQAMIAHHIVILYIIDMIATLNRVSPKHRSVVEKLLIHANSVHPGLTLRGFVFTPIWATLYGHVNLVQSVMEHILPLGYLTCISDTLLVAADPNFDTAPLHFILDYNSISALPKQRLSDIDTHTILFCAIALLIRNDNTTRVFFPIILEYFRSNSYEHLITSYLVPMAYFRCSRMLPIILQRLSPESQCEMAVIITTISLDMPHMLEIPLCRPNYLDPNVQDVIISWTMSQNLLTEHMSCIITMLHRFPLTPIEIDTFVQRENLPITLLSAILSTCQTPTPLLISITSEKLQSLLTADPPAVKTAFSLLCEAKGLEQYENITGKYLRILAAGAHPSVSHNSITRECVRRIDVHALEVAVRSYTMITSIECKYTMNWLVSKGFDLHDLDVRPFITSHVSGNHGSRYCR